MINRLYNSELKKAYLNSLDDKKSTKETIEFEFSKSAEIEKQYSKDLYCFNDSEIVELVKSLKYDNTISIMKTLSIYKKYVNWCILNGQRGKYENRINNIEMFQKTEKDLFKYVSNRKVKNKFLSKEELDDLLNALINPIDVALVYAMYELIGGEKLYELRSLQMKNINKSSMTVELFNIDGNSRTQKISYRLLDLLEDAKKQEVYIFNNGNISPTSKISERKLVSSEYIFRSLANKSNLYEMMTYATTINKITNIKKYTGYDFITANSLKETRIIHEIYNLTEKRNLYEPDDNIYEEVASKIKKEYNLKISNMQLYSIKQKYNKVVKLKDFD